MAVNSRGGGYDLAEQKDSEKKKSLGTETRQSQSLGAQASARSPGENPNAPTSIGQLMSPSLNTQSSQLDPNDETYNRQVEKNRTFLSSPEVRSQLLQFGVSLLAGNMPGEALGKAITLPARARSADAKLLKEQRESERADLRLSMEVERLGMDKDKISEDKQQKETRRALIGALSTMSDDKLMQTASELAAEGDDEGARTVLSMMKSMRDPQTEGLISQYKLALAQGFKGTIVEFKNATDNLSVIEGIRAKIAAGIAPTPGEQQVYDDATNSNLLMKILDDAMKEGKISLGGGGGGTTTTPSVAAPPSGTSGNVRFEVVPE